MATQIKYDDLMYAKAMSPVVDQSKLDRSIIHHGNSPAAALQQLLQMRLATANDGGGLPLPSTAIANPVEKGVQAVSRAMGPLLLLGAMGALAFAFV